ncbi:MULTISPECIES: HobA family DNA replication regulator [unclassified Nitratiruptor]|uniref:HobA family DNA replication regulator n=1 Tax=unclassified Nitratiruptor TaxID=2624044 RepID=UPI001915DE4B|nr:MULTISPECIES: HobA family DNA replication regulator [unclassified Nitratiruptor]BCD60138.1 hypothetical protein NitYY0810_C0903 [Nitratiruptor sp. YY08-10]BCD64373.1 hypothetical protein NitYY0814_C1218 [Nitratiruptor sp. YY08-14]
MSEQTTFDQWTLKTIRYDKSMMNWLEERRYDWLPLAMDALKKIISGYSVLMLTDDERDWFCDYAITTFNKSLKTRPFIPIYNLKKTAPYLKNIQTNEDIELFFDMLDISYAGEYFIWYVGRSNYPLVKIAKRKDDSFLWIMDEDMQNNFTLKSYDELLDMKLLQLFRLFEKSLDAAIFGEFTLEL